ncbi:hypothetical protein Droror1_Dr00022850 [Drosera rotundifolia]
MVITEIPSTETPASSYYPSNFVLPVLRCHGLLGLVDGTLSRPAGDDHDPMVLAWLRLDQMILAWWASSLPDTVLPQVIHSSSKEI